MCLVMEKHLFLIIVQNTQVCLVNKRGISKNLGLISSDFEVHEDFISISFKDGSSCDKDKYIETNIHLVCSFHDENPILVSKSNCAYQIIWKTKAACPNYVFLGKSCQIYDTFYGSRNFAPLFTNDSETLISNHLVRYNLCDSLFTPCGLYNNASICVHLNGEDVPYGWMHSPIISNNRKLTMDFIGDVCYSSILRSAHINFHCDNSNSRDNKIIFSRDMCRIDIDIYVDLACPQNPTANCVIHENNQEYNLQSLALPDSNYEIQDIYNSNVIYIINICKPVIYNENVLCDLYSSVCARNNTEPNVHKKFKSLGNIQSFSLSVKKGNVIMQYNSGICITLQQTTVVIEFEFICDRFSQQRHPILSYKDDCNFKFIWKTSAACGVRK